MENVIENEQDWLLEAFYKVFSNLEKAEQETVRSSLNVGNIHLEKARNKEPIRY